MSSTFRTMATIAVWVLFIWGIATILITEVRYWVTIGITHPPTPATFSGWALGTVQLTLSVVCMKLRQKLEKSILSCSQLLSEEQVDAALPESATSSEIEVRELSPKTLLYWT